MKLNERDKRALMLLAVAAVAMIGWRIWVEMSATSTVVELTPAAQVAVAEKRLLVLRQLIAAREERQKQFTQVRDELAKREGGLIKADTSAQAQAQLLQVMRRIGRQQGIEIRNVEIGAVKAIDKDYGEVGVAVSFDCRIEQLLNLLADLTAQKELIGTTDLRVGNASPKEKLMPVRLAVTGVVRRELIPDKKETVF